MNSSDTKTIAPGAIHVTRKDVDANGPYYDLQITLENGQVLNARYNTSTGSANEGNGAVSGSSGSQTSGSMPVAVIDPARTDGPGQVKIEIDPQALRAAIDAYEREQSLGMLQQQDKKQEQQQSRSSGMLLQLPEGLSEHERAMSSERFLSMDLSFLHGTGFSYGAAPRGFEANLAQADRAVAPQMDQGAAPQSPATEIPAHVRDLARAVAGSISLATSAGFNQPNGTLPGMDFAHKSTVPAMRAPAQARSAAFA